MRNIRIFVKTYWQHAKSILDFVLFIVSLVALLSGVQVALARPVGAALIFIVVVFAAYRTWFYQYEQTQSLIKLQKGELEFNNLNDVQKAILLGMSSESDKRILSTGGMDGAVFMGIGDAANSYKGDEIGAEIVELEKIDVLRVDSYSSKSGRPVYVPTRLGLKILKQASKEGKSDQ